jgi:hypothetical protein
MNRLKLITYVHQEKKKDGGAPSRGRKKAESESSKVTTSNRTTAAVGKPGRKPTGRGRKPIALSDDETSQQKDNSSAANSGSETVEKTKQDGAGFIPIEVPVLTWYFSRQSERQAWSKGEGAHCGRGEDQA